MSITKDSFITQDRNEGFAAVPAIKTQSLASSRNEVFNDFIEILAQINQAVYDRQLKHKNKKISYLDCEMLGLVG